jgi:NitT/TauT family transport system permease protein
VILVILGLWWLLAVGPAKGVLPMPLSALAAFARDLMQGAYWGHVAASSFRAASAMALSFALAFPLGVLMGGVPKVDKALSPFVFLTYPVPKIVLLPVMLILLGLGDTAKIGMIVLILSYQILVTTRDGVRAIHPKHIDTVRSLGGGFSHVLTQVLVPAGLPHGFTALRLGTGVSVAVLFFVESFATQQGLGYYIMDSWGRMAFDKMFSGIFGMSALGVALYEITNLLEKKTCRWRKDR